MGCVGEMAIDTSWLLVRTSAVGSRICMYIYTIRHLRFWAPSIPTACSEGTRRIGWFVFVVIYNNIITIMILYNAICPTPPKTVFCARNTIYRRRKPFIRIMQ